MTTWKLNVPITGSMTIEIHADTEQEAREILADDEYEPDVALCGYCSGYTSHVNNYPLRFGIDLDQLDQLEFDHFSKEG